MCQSGCLFLLLEIVKLLASVDAAIGETVRIHGVLACGGAPVLGARLKLYDGDGLKDDGTIANYDDEFLFQVKDIEPSILYLTINHHCDGGIFRKRCIRKDQLVFQEITKKRLIYHIGLLELQHTNISHPKVLHNIQSHDGCKCYEQNLFYDNSIACIKLIKMNEKKNSKIKQQKLTDEI